MQDAKEMVSDKVSDKVSKTIPFEQVEREYITSHIKRLKGATMFNDKVIIMPDLPKVKTESGLHIPTAPNSFDAPQEFKAIVASMHDNDMPAGYVLVMGTEANKQAGYKDLAVYKRVYFRRSVYDIIMADGVPYMVMRIADLFGIAPKVDETQFLQQKLIRADYERRVRDSAPRI